MVERAGSGVKYSQRRKIGKIVPAPAKSQRTLQPDPMLASMLPEELKAAMVALDCPTQSALAREIGVDRSTVSLWLEGRIGVPRPVAKLVRLMVSQAQAQATAS